MGLIYKRELNDERTWEDYHFPELQPGKFLEQPWAQSAEHRVVRALSWNQPFATLMEHGKQETRTRYTKVRGWVLICSCKKPYNYETIKAISGEEQTYRLTELLYSKGKPHFLDLCGKALSIGHLYGCRYMTSSETDENDCFVKWRAGLWVWQFRNVHPIEPFPWKGKQGWGKVDEETQKKIIIL